jgi:AraC-like DNA-binding protein
MELCRPRGLWAGFWAFNPDQKVPELIGAGEQWACDQWEVEWHQHAGWELHLQLQGNTLWKTNRAIYEVAPGDFLALPPRLNHSTHRKQVPAEQHFVFAVIDLAAVRFRFPELDDLLDKREVIVIRSVPQLQTAFRLLMTEICQDSALRNLGLQLAVDYLVLGVTRVLRRRTKTADPIIFNPAIVRVKNTLDHAYQNDWHLTDLARIARLSVGHLTEMFTRELGTTPHQYLMQVRINRAKELLQYPEMSITNVAIDLGFCSSQHFARCFKQQTGVTARAFRSLSRRSPTNRGKGPGIPGFSSGKTSASSHTPANCNISESVS